MNKIKLREIKEENKNEEVIMKGITEENKEPR